MRVSRVSWTDFSSGDLNFVTGCTPISAGCQNCYARAIYERFGKDHSKVEAHPDKLERLATMRFPEHSPKRGAPHRPMAFVVDTGDLFHPDVPTEFIIETFDVMDHRKDVIWQVLTKRAGRMRAVVWELQVLSGVHLDNIWLGVTVEDQQAADERIPLLLDTPAAVRWVSVEPMLAPVDLDRHLWRYDDERGTPFRAPANGWDRPPALAWVICGAESGPNRRPFDVAWALDLYRQCEAAGVRFFYKQGSALRPGQDAILPGVGVVQQWPEEVGA